MLSLLNHYIKTIKQLFKHQFFDNKTLSHECYVVFNCY